MRLLITGSRNWTNRDTIHNAIREAYGTLQLAYAMDGTAGPLTVVHGACPNGADRIAHQYATDQTWATPEPHPADWTRHRKQAGIIRNAAMVATGADMCQAFIEKCDVDCGRTHTHGTHGAVHCANLAAESGIPTTAYVHEWLGGQGLHRSIRIEVLP